MREFPSKDEVVKAILLELRVRIWAAQHGRPLRVRLLEGTALTTRHPAYG